MAFTKAWQRNPICLLMAVFFFHLQKAKRRKRAEKEREQGVKRLKLQPVIKPPVLKICNYYLKGRCQQVELSIYLVILPRLEGCRLVYWNIYILLLNHLFIYISSSYIVWYIMILVYMVASLDGCVCNWCLLLYAISYMVRWNSNPSSISHKIFNPSFCWILMSTFLFFWISS